MKIHQADFFPRSRFTLKGHWTSKTSSSPKFFKKVGIFIPMEVLAWVLTACWVLRSRLTYFWWNMNISSVFYFSKSSSINTQYSCLWDTMKMMLFTKYLKKTNKQTKQNKTKQKQSVKSAEIVVFVHLKSSIELDIKDKIIYLSNAPLK